MSTKSNKATKSNNNNKKLNNSTPNTNTNTNTNPAKTKQTPKKKVEKKKNPEDDEVLFPPPAPVPEEEDFDYPPQDLDLDIEKEPGKIVNQSGDMSMKQLAAIPPELIYTATIWPNLRAPKADLGALWEDPLNRAVIMKFLYFSVILWVVPFAVFYGVDYFVEDWPNRTLFSGLAAAFSVQIVIGCYIISAIREGDERLDGPAPNTKQPKSHTNPNNASKKKKVKTQ
eukprot:TRINITY_DN1501_c0_g4_i1.p1 TRINITY_DN1501_c0_g4~~TRINITY_DN1501_c0_g4_i1.p1  ORF type:complete len:227 (+),score=66.15 TRINITY_DN1501_c0_g4_i1:73-753(+)